MTAPADVAAVFAREYGRAVSVLIRVLGDIDLAEDAVQDAFAEAVRRWPADGLPPAPARWIITTARRRAVDRHRRDSAREARDAAAARLDPAGPDAAAAPGGTGETEEDPWATTGYG
jgi:RNA polymerase sigma-70 factor (ECF subfamily)